MKPTVSFKCGLVKVIQRRKRVVQRLLFVLGKLGHKNLHRALGTDKVRGRVRMTTKSFYRVAEPEAHYRRCPDWYELQPRPRGTVLNPHMRCWWVRGP